MCVVCEPDEKVQQNDKGKKVQKQHIQPFYSTFNVIYILLMENQYDDNGNLIPVKTMLTKRYFGQTDAILSLIFIFRSKYISRISPFASCSLFKVVFLDPKIVQGC